MTKQQVEMWVQSVENSLGQETKTGDENQDSGVMSALQMLKVYAQREMERDPKERVHQKVLDIVDRLLTDTAYSFAENYGLTGFDVDVDLSPQQNLDMARANFEMDAIGWIGVKQLG